MKNLITIALIGICTIIQAQNEYIDTYGYNDYATQNVSNNDLSSFEMLASDNDIDLFEEDYMDLYDEDSISHNHSDFSDKEEYTAEVKNIEIKLLSDDFNNSVELIFHICNSQSITLVLRNSSGKIVQKAKVNAETGDNYLYINLNRYPDGEYIAKLEQGRTSGLVRIIK